MCKVWGTGKTLLLFACFAFFLVPASPHATPPPTHTPTRPSPRPFKPLNPSDVFSGIRRIIVYLPCEQINSCAPDAHSHCETQAF